MGCGGGGVAVAFLMGERGKLHYREELGSQNRCFLQHRVFFPQSTCLMRSSSRK